MRILLHYILQFVATYSATILKVPCQSVKKIHAHFALISDLVFDEAITFQRYPVSIQIRFGIFSLHAE